MHRLDDFGSPVGMVCLAISSLLGAFVQCLNAYAGLIGLASSLVFGSIGTIYTVKTYRLREEAAERQRKAERK